MIFIKVPSTSKDLLDIELENLGVPRKGTSVFSYINVTNWNIHPYMDENNQVVVGKSILKNDVTGYILAISYSPEEYIQKVNGTVIFDYSTLIDREQDN